MDSATQNRGTIPQQPSSTQTQPTKPPTMLYKFPHNKLKHCTTKANPIVLVSCGSFSPISILHLQMFEITERYIKSAKFTGPNFEVVGSYLSPVSDAYQKPSLVPAHHRLEMCSIAAEDTRNLMVDSWEALRCNEAGEPVYTKTIDVLRHFDHEINEVLGGIQAPDGACKRAQIVLIIGADVAIPMADPNIWAASELDRILGGYGAFIVERPAQIDINQALGSLRKYDKIWVVGPCYNDVSSTKIRDQIRRGENVVGLPDKMIEYIRSNHLYQEAVLAMPQEK
ncbi:Nucleotidylyl transferase [Stipitochalara longipes BDJ]|nr:Nucleotidylyl transferase [Stipitochalara longipes BDJ]